MNEDFEEAINEKEALVLFYAPWCGFSRRFLPTFEEYSLTCSKKCTIVNKEKSPDLCDEYSIRYYPTVIWFKNGKIWKRLDSKPGIGLNKEQLVTFTFEE
ncbi:MAG: protein disulfide isomerase family protein [Candidatus Bathyarchaeota archaeon]|jgi:thioredoxin 1